MPLILLIISLVILWCSKVNTDVALSESNDRVERKRKERKYWNDNVFDNFLSNEIKGVIADKCNADIVCALIEELSELAPELRQNVIILYDSQLDSSFTKKEKLDIIYNNIRFLTPFMMAKQGKVNDCLGVTFPQQLVINDGTSCALKKSKESPWGLSQNSIINLNKWLEKTLRLNGVPDAKIVYAEMFLGKQFCWEALSQHGGERLW